MADNKCSTPDCGGNCDSCNGDITVTLTLDNDETVECAILTIFPVDGRDYIALLPLDENGENDFCKVPQNDYRSIRRAILNMAEFDSHIQKINTR